VIWYVARTAGSIVAAFTYAQPGYAEEALDDASSAELQAFLAPPIPQVIERSQGIRQLAADSKLAAALSVVAGADDLTQQLWYSPTWQRSDPMLVGLSTAIGYDTDAKRDAFFAAAAKIT
jgi:hypothetical protein